MGVYISGLEIPPKGKGAVVVLCSSGAVYSGGQKVGTAVPVSAHYDLIDHNALKIAVMNGDCETRLDFLKHTLDCINKAPVVIKSDNPMFEEAEYG